MMMMYNFEFVNVLQRVRLGYLFIFTILQLSVYKHNIYLENYNVSY